MGERVYVNEPLMWGISLTLVGCMCGGCMVFNIPTNGYFLIFLMILSAPLYIVIDKFTHVYAKVRKRLSKRIEREFKKYINLELYKEFYANNPKRLKSLLDSNVNREELEKVETTLFVIDDGFNRYSIYAIHIIEGLYYNVNKIELNWFIPNNHNIIKCLKNGDIPENLLKKLTVDSCFCPILFYAKEFEVKVTPTIIKNKKYLFWNYFLIPADYFVRALDYCFTHSIIRPLIYYGAVVSAFWFGFFSNIMDYLNYQVGVLGLISIIYLLYSIRERHIVWEFDYKYSNFR